MQEQQQKPQAQTAPTIVFPSQSLLEGYQYTPAAGTSVQDTWRRFGWQPTTEEQRAKQQEKRT